MYVHLGVPWPATHLFCHQIFGLLLPYPHRKLFSFLPFLDPAEDVCTPECACGTLLLKYAYLVNEVHDLNLVFVLLLAYPLPIPITHPDCSVGQLFHEFLLLFEDLALCNT